jgi:hypothetical protein
MKAEVHDIKEKKKASTTSIQEKPFPGKVPDAGVFADKFNAANEVGRTIKGIKGRKSK